MRLYLEKVIWWWQLWCKERWAPLSATKFGWSVKIKSMQDDKFGRRFGMSVKIKSMQDDKFGRRCVESDINWCNPHDVVSNSSRVPSWDVLSSHHHDLDLTLKSPSLTKIDDCNWLIWFKSFSKFKESHQMHQLID